MRRDIVEPNPAMTWNSEMTAEAARRRLAKHEDRIKKLGNLRREARKEAERLAREIGGADLSVRKIWGFGSVFEDGRPFREDSDIDLASDGGGLTAWRISEKSSWKVDWVELDEQDEAFAGEIRKKGFILYERH